MLNISSLSCRYAHTAAYQMSILVNLSAPNSTYLKQSIPTLLPNLFLSPCFNEQHIYPTARARNLPLPSQLPLLFSPTLSDFPPYFSDLVTSCSSCQHLSSDWYFSPAYHPVSCPASPQGSCNGLSVDATQVRPFPA